jgi:GT2 family glycosyltransferase
VSSPQPLITVVVPAHERAQALRRCLEALAASSLPRDRWELIVVLHVTDAETAVVAAQYANLVVRLPADPLGPEYARNRGVEVSRGELLVFVSADVCVEPDALAAFAQALQNPEVGAVNGVYESAPHDSPLTDFQVLYNRFVRDRAAGEVDAFFSGFAAVRRLVLASAGGFDEWCDNRPRVAAMELGQRIRALGYRVLLDASIRATHLKRRSLAHMLEQTLRDHGVPYEEHDAPPAEEANEGLRWVRRRERLSPALCWLAVDCAALALFAHLGRWMWATAAAAFLAVLLLNAPFYSFAVRQRSLLSLLSIVPVHFVGSMLMGTARLSDRLFRWLVGEPRPDPAIEAFAEVGLKTWPPVPIRRAPIASQSAGV